ncbi:MAG: hypothetical protein HYW90_00805 [Candidatus Sungbacteria bacterium]|nr:hypothetical protein [Candidatus Sungbacteria bacterium]
MKKKTKIYIGLIGEKGSGKDTVTEFLKKLLPGKKVRHVTFSDVLSETLDLWFIPRTRANYQKLVPMMVDTFGDATLATITRRRAETLEADVICIPGMRWPADLRMVRSLNGNNSRSFVVYVTAPAKTRYLRLKKRRQKVGEDKTTFRKFMQEEKARTEMDIPKMGKKADLTIVNDGTMKDFCNTVRLKLLPLIAKK